MDKSIEERSRELLASAYRNGGYRLAAESLLAGRTDSVDECALEAITAALSAPKLVGGSDIYEAYKSWPADIRKKLSLQDLRRMSGWAPRTAVSDWRIDTSAGGPILVYQNCSVIEGEQARYVLGLIEKDSAPQPVEPTGDDWYTDPDTGTHTLDLDDNPNRQLSIMLKSDGTAVFAAYIDGEKIVGAAAEDFLDVVFRLAAPQSVEAEGRDIEAYLCESGNSAYLIHANDVERLDGYFADGFRIHPLGRIYGVANATTTPPPEQPLPLSVQKVLDRWKGVIEDGECFGYSPSEIEIIRLMAEEMARAVSPPEQPAIDLEQFRRVLSAYRASTRERERNGDLPVQSAEVIYDEVDRLLDIIDGAKGERPVLPASALRPRTWTVAMSEAWHRAIPDTVKAFDDLIAAAEAGRAEGEEL